MDPSDLTHRFEYHPPPDDRVAALHAEARRLHLELAQKIAELTIAGREQSLAVTKLEESLFWTNAAIARAGARGSA